MAYAPKTTIAPTVGRAARSDRDPIERGAPACTAERFEELVAEILVSQRLRRLRRYGRYV